MVQESYLGGGGGVAIAPSAINTGKNSCFVMIMFVVLVKALLQTINSAPFHAEPKNENFLCVIVRALKLNIQNNNFTA
jgi:hypothetical protein